MESRKTNKTKASRDNQSVPRDKKVNDGKNIQAEHYTKGQKY